MRTYTIELRVDFDDDADTKKLTMDKAVRMAAKHLLANALVISDKRKPEITAQYDDFWIGTEEINLEEDIPSATTDDEDPFNI
jgi:hypothetical protein